MKLFRTGHAFFLLLCFDYYELKAQHSSPDSIAALPVSQNIIFDGKLNESGWQNLNAIIKEWP